MPVAKTRFNIRYDDVVVLQDAIQQVGYESEKIINNHLHNVTGQQMVEGITKFIPVSKKGARHAKYNKWWEQNNYNMAVNLETSTKGRRGTSFYYLYYVITGTGTSYDYGERDFMEQGMDASYNKIVDDLINEVMNHIERSI